ncbi:MAG: hypothetical protein AB2693_29525 [Candidatus Thiodiazotropha sp.]
MGSASTRSIKYHGQFEIQTSYCSSEPPAIVAMEVTSSGGLLVCDKANMKVKLFDDYFRPVTEVSLPAEPYGMVLVEHNKMLVSLPDSHCLQSLTLSNDQRLTLKEKIQTELKCDRMINYGDSLIVSSHDQKAISLNIINLNGQVIRCIRKEDITPGGMFNNLGFIALSPDNSVIYVTEMCNGCIGVSVSTGEILFVYKESRTKFLFGVCTDSEGYVYISSTDREKMVMLDSQGNKVKQLATLSDSSPGFMTYSTLQKKLFIKTVYTNKILVYKLA